MQWRMLQQDNPDDYVIASGRTESVRKFIELSAKALGWNKNKNEPSIVWEGTGLEEIGRRSDTNEIVIKIDSRYFRPTEVDYLLGDASKARRKLGWYPKITLEEMIEEMINYDNQESLVDYKSNFP